MAISLPEAVAAVIEHRALLSREQLERLRTALAPPPRDFRHHVTDEVFNVPDATRPPSIADLDITQEIVDQIEFIKRLRNGLSSDDDIGDQTKVLTAYNTLLTNLIKMKRAALDIEDRHKLKEAILAAFEDCDEKWRRQAFIQKLEDLTK